MPSRKSTVKINGGPQGKDAFVTIKIQTVAESQDISQRIRESSDEEERGRIGFEIIKEAVVDMNWVDEDGKRLFDQEDWVNSLTIEEFSFISEAIKSAGQNDKKKY